MQKYISLIRGFLNREITAENFERQYLDTYLNDNGEMTIAEFELLSTLFGAVESFCADPFLRDDRDLDEVQLQEAAKKALDQLLKM